MNLGYACTVCARACSVPVADVATVPREPFLAHVTNLHRSMGGRDLEVVCPLCAAEARTVIERSATVPDLYEHVMVRHSSGVCMRVSSCSLVAALLTSPPSLTGRAS